jgi:hypothetical protein
MSSSGDLVRMAFRHLVPFDRNEGPDGSVNTARSSVVSPRDASAR